ncbi:hypothetical protein LTR66_009396, partial [Elasticomyces elasticus]
MQSVTGKKYNGGTTVAGTMILAHLAGIKVFATGGLGGVHRGAENSMDISTDLTELGRTPVAVISSGCKSFLDISRTLEYLETQGVGVATFSDGRASRVDFPAFWSRDSGIRSPSVLQNEKEAAALIHAQHGLGLQSGLLLANPIPEQFSIPRAEMDSIIEHAIREADAAGTTGNTDTPFILAKIRELTKGGSVPANRALIEANVKRGTIVAKELMELEKAEGIEPTVHVPSSQITGLGTTNYTASGVSIGITQAVKDSQLHRGDRTEVTATTTNANEQSADIFVAGALAVDFNCDYSPQSKTGMTSPALRTSNPARITQSLGGVAHNVARAASLMGGNVRLCSAVSDDFAGKAALEALRIEGLSDTAIKVLPASSGFRTAQYVAMNDERKDLMLAMADMSILEDDPNPRTPSSDQTSIQASLASFWFPQLQAQHPSHLVLDANWPPHLLSQWLHAGKAINAHVSFEPVSA